ncbi:NAD-dependent protein deacylase [candidate division KSB3 bacterium]|uniref:protein acetyllysine N-acetyltransferase n=1 Tax=candidate division KSB3 bacterium TaxID=2044937 RepID=A0A2G6E2D7_9BACT|nr:MAG: NAD-dependent protein deacylase [candidate division KSB3 bacterium]PIE28827.1 MAG: NAD-dependent protein deacylase [candidate division KSB3 bacterium]
MSIVAFDTLYESIASCLHASRKILFITGAGISADSGLPTYRGLGGLYEKKDTEEGIPIETAISAMMLHEHPEITWKYLWQIGVNCRDACPNRAHEIISRLQEYKPDTWVLTQNIDGLHRAAGTKNVIEMHGDAFEMRCMKCGSPYTFDVIFPLTVQRPELPPRCLRENCRGIIRPNVVLFGEYLPSQAYAQLQALLDQGLDMVLSIGTSCSLPYITAPLYTPGIPTVEINPVETVVSEKVSYRIPLGAAEAMEGIWKAFCGR